MGKKKFFWIPVVCLLATFLFLSRPVSFWDMTGADRDTIYSLSAATVTGGVNSGYPAGRLTQQNLPCPR